MTQDRDEDKTESVGPGLVLGLFGVALAFGITYLSAPRPVAKATVVREPGSEEEDGSGMSSFIGPGRTPKGWREGANIFGG